MRNITVVGVGYVGLVTGTCFADLGNRIVCLDIQEERIANLKKGILPNGLTYYILPHGKPEGRAFLWLAVIIFLVRVIQGRKVI